MISCFILDEPETHLNPTWRTKFINILNTKTKNRDQDIVITTHSPYIVSDCRGYRVYKFIRKGEAVSFDKIDMETYGTSFDLILKKAFDIDTTISDEVNEEFKELIKGGTENAITAFIGETGPKSFEKLGLIKHLKSLKN